MAQYGKEGRRRARIKYEPYNTSILMAIGNDYEFAEICARQLRAHVTSRPLRFIFVRTA